jgi:superfamily II DNA or RNA helicase
MKQRSGAASAPIVVIPVVERLTPDVVASWLPEEILDKARLDIAEGRVARPAIRQNDIETVVADARRGNVRVRITWGYAGPVARCECGSKKESPCRHAASLGLLLIGERGAAADIDEGRLDAEGAGALPTIAERELAVRRERGASELFRIRWLEGGPIYGHYEVRSPSSRRYGVVIRALDRPHNSCSCPDFEANLLGSCKHIEAVLHRLRKRNKGFFNETAMAGPAGSYLHLRFSPDPAIGVHLAKRAGSAARRLVADHFRADGCPVAPGELLASWPDFAPAAIRAGIEIPAEVERFVGRMREADRREREGRATEAEVRSAGREQPGFLATLYPYQVEGVAFLAARKRALLADEMGLGKTAQAIAAMVRMMRKGEVRRTLIVCPSSLKRQWEREIERFAGLASPRVAVLGGRREERRGLYETPPEVLITSYELARTDEADVISLAPDLLILDEAQKIRNWRTKTAEMIKRIPSRFVFVLTGTPLENRLDDLYSLIQVIDTHLFGPLWRFNHEFTELDERGRVTGYKNLDELRRRVARVMRRRRKEEVLTELPAQIVNRLTVPMTSEQASIHEDAARQIGMLLSALKKRPLTPLEERRLMRSFQRMRMACDAAGLVDKETRGAPKLNELEGLLEELCVQAGHKVVVFSEWERMLAMAAEVCDSLGVGYVRLHGAVPSDARGRLIDRFFSDPGCKVFFSTDAGGVGLNLQAASHVINLDLPWNPAVLAQRIARVHRIGQPNAVNVVLMISEASFEENLEAALDAKRALFAAAVGDDAETAKISRSSLASRIETLMGGSFAATTGTRREEATQAEDPVSVLRARLGDALERIVRLPNGRLLGVVRGSVVPTMEVPALLLPEDAAEALAPLGDVSPLAQGELIFRAEPKSLSARSQEGRRARLAVAERKLKAAQALLEAGLRVEALGLLRETLSLGCRAAFERGEPGDDPAALLSAIYGDLLPAGAIEAADAHALVRSGELFRAFDGAAIPPPEPLVVEIDRAARDLLARVRERLGSSPGALTAG